MSIKFMTDRRTTRLVMQLTLLTGLISTALAADVVQGQKIHLVVAYDDTPEAGLGSDIATDKINMIDVFQSNVPRRQLELIEISGASLKANGSQGVINTIRNLNVDRRRDSVVFYFTGHGKYDQKQGHVLVLPNRQTLVRNDLEQAIRDKEPRTLVTITDCCSVGPRALAANIRRPKGFPPTRIDPLFEHLFFDFAGEFRFNSSSMPTAENPKGQLSITRGDGKGSLFTYPFVEALRRPEGKPRKIVSWVELINQVGTEVAEDFKQITKGKGIDTNNNGDPDQFTQTVYAFMITPRLGLRVQEKKGQLVVNQVVGLSPAFHAGLELNDIVTRVDGKAVKTEEEFSMAIDNIQGKQVRLDVYDHRAKRNVQILVKMNPT